MHNNKCVFLDFVKYTRSCARDFYFSFVTRFLIGVTYSPNNTVISGVFLSISAVRFGRIPKREKQRMLLEMQNAMNNMMSNSSQLHTMLHNQLSPGDGGSPPSSSSSSSASDSSSCSSPASPQCPQDSESVLSMDTNSSSAYSCGSDSGEDEAMVAVSGSRQDAFAYRQQGQSQASRSLVAMPTEAGCDSRMEEAAEESWTCWNRNAAVEAHRQRSHSPHIVNAAFREEGGVSLQQRNCAPCGYPEEARKSWHQFQRQPGFGGHAEPGSCPNNRTRLVTDSVFAKDVVSQSFFFF